MQVLAYRCIGQDILHPSECPCIGIQDRIFRTAKASISPPPHSLAVVIPLELSEVVREERRGEEGGQITSFASFLFLIESAEEKEREVVTLRLEVSG